VLSRFQSLTYLLELQALRDQALRNEMVYLHTPKSYNQQSDLSLEDRELASVNRILHALIRKIENDKSGEVKIFGMFSITMANLARLSIAALFSFGSSVLRIGFASSLPTAL